MLGVYNSICEQLQRLPLEEDERVSHRWLASNGCLNQIMSWIYLYSLCRYSPNHTKSYHAIPNHIVNEVMSARCCISKYHGCKDATEFRLPLGPPWKSTWIRGWSWIRCGRWCSILWGLLTFQCFHIVGNLQKHGVFGNYWKSSLGMDSKCGFVWFWMFSDSMASTWHTVSEYPCWVGVGLPKYVGQWEQQATHKTCARMGQPKYRNQTTSTA